MLHNLSQNTNYYNLYYTSFHYVNIKNSLKIKSCEITLQCIITNHVNT